MSETRCALDLLKSATAPEQLDGLDLCKFVAAGR